MASPAPDKKTEPVTEEDVLDSQSNKQAQEAFTKGNEALKEKEFNKALSYYSEAIDFAPLNSKYLCMRSLLYFELGKLNESLSDAVDAINVDPKDPNGYFRKCMALMVKGDVELAFETAQEGMQVTGQTNQALRAVQVMAMYAAHRYKELIPIAHEFLADVTIELDEDRLVPKVTHCLAVAMKRLCSKEGDAFELDPSVDDAFHVSQLHLSKNKNILEPPQESEVRPVPPEFQGMEHADAEAHVSALILAGSGEIERGNGNTAKQFFENALMVVRSVGIVHREAEVIVLLGVAYRLLGKLKESIEIQKEALNSFGPKSKVYSGLGNTYFADSKLVEALDFHKKHLEIEKATNPEGSGVASAHNNIACVNSYLGHHDIAIPDFEVYREYAIKTNYNLGLVSSCNNIASCYLHLKLYDKCLETLQQAVQAHGKLYDEVTRHGSHSSQRHSYATYVRGTYKLASELYIDTHKFDAAFEITERSKTLTFLDTMSSRLTTSNQIFASTNDLVKLAQEENITFLSYTVLPKGKVYSYVVETNGAVHMMPITIPSDFVWDPNAFASYLNSDSASPGSVSARDLKRMNSAVNRNMQAKSILEKLFTFYLAPVERFLPKGPQNLIVILPHHKLYAIPWNALLDSSGRHAIELHTFLVAPCAATFLANVQHRREMTDANKGGIVVGDSSIRDASQEQQDFASLGYSVVDGTATPAQEYTKNFSSAANIHLQCRITVKDIAGMTQEVPVQSSPYSATCRTRDTPAALLKHSNEEATGSLYFGKSEGITIEFRAAHALSVSELPTLPSLKACKLLSIHTVNAAFDDMGSSKTNLVNFLRGFQAAGATCIATNTLPIPTGSFNTGRIFKSIAERCSGLTNRNGVAFAVRDALLEAKANQLPWTMWGIITVFM
eukprot:PhF_6_TR27122/c0_g1_i1/m.39527